MRGLSQADFAALKDLEDLPADMEREGYVSDSQFTPPFNPNLRPNLTPI